MKLSMRVLGAMGMLAAGAVVCGCGVPATSAGCTNSYRLMVSPTSATADHNAAAPGNQVQFSGASAIIAPAGCAAPAVMVPEYATWDNPDPINIQISSARDATNGIAVCKGVTSGAVTLTGHFSAASTSLGNPPAETATVQLTCK